MENQQSYQDICSAVREGNLERVRELINSFGLFHSRGYFLLRRALRNQHAAVAKLLLTNGTEVNGETSKPLDTPLHLAVMNDDIEIVDMILEKGANIEARNESGQTPFHVAIKRGRLQIAEDLLKYGADINCRCIIWKKDYTPLHLAVEKGDTYADVVMWLLYTGADVDVQGENHMTPLHIAAKNGCIRIAKYLLSYGACIHSSTLTGGYTPLHFASELDNEETMQLLLDRGADVNVQAENNITPLHIAAKNGYICIAEYLLSYGACIYFSTLKGGCTPLHIATMNGHEKVVKLLLQHGAQVDNQDEYGRTILHLAVERENLAIVEGVLKYCPDINNRSNRNSFEIAVHGNGEEYKKIVEALLEYGFIVDSENANDPHFLCAAVRKGYLKIVEDLLMCGAVINTSDEYGRTLLHFTVKGVASDDSAGEIAKLLLSKGAHVDARTEKGETALYTAIRKEYAKVVEVLLDYNANVICGERSDVTSLHLSAQRENAEITRLLLNGGANVNAEQEDGSTALHIAAGEGHKEVVKLLLECGAKVDSEMKNGTTPLHIAAEKGHKEIVKVLLECGAKVDFKMKNGSTPLHIAAQRGHNEIVKVLLECGAKIDSKRKNGTTPLHLGAHMGFLFSHCLCCERVAGLRDFSYYTAGEIRMGYMETIETLLEFGADINSRDEWGKTALHIASGVANNKVVTTLLEHGSDINITSNDNDTPLDHVMAIIRSSESDTWNYDDCYLFLSDAIGVVAETLKRHIVKLKTANLYVNKQNLLLMSSSDEISNFEDECEKEIESMESEEINNANVSFYDILAKDTNSLARYMNNENIVQILELDTYKTKFPIYARMIENNFKKGMKRKELLERGNESFHILFNNLFKLLPECVEKISNDLSDEDLRNLIDTFKLTGINDPSVNDVVIP